MAPLACALALDALGTEAHVLHPLHTDEGAAALAFLTVPVPAPCPATFAHAVVLVPLVLAEALRVGVAGALAGAGVRRREPGPVTRFFEGGRVSQTLYGVSKTLLDST